MLGKKLEEQLKGCNYRMVFASLIAAIVAAFAGIWFPWRQAQVEERIQKATRSGMLNEVAPTQDTTKDAVPASVVHYLYQVSESPTSLGRFPLSAQCEFVSIGAEVVGTLKVASDEGGVAEQALHSNKPIEIANGAKKYLIKVVSVNDGSRKVTVSVEERSVH